METRIWPGNTRITVACSIQGMLSSARRLSSKLHKKYIAAKVFAEDRQQIGAGHFGKPAGLDVAGAGDAETRIAFEIMR